jgi:hypothetical protein
MLTKEKFAIYRLFFGVLGLSAVATEITVLIYRNSFVPSNFFSFFTIQSNLLAAAVFLAGAVLLLRGKRKGVPDMWRGAATLYMVITGVIFMLLLSGLDSIPLTAMPWDNTVLHYIMPIAVLADWIMDPPKRKIAFRKAVPWLAFPIAYLVYTLIRGHYTEWYPYPFLNALDKGYATVLSTAVIVALFVTGMAWLLTRVSARKK